MRLNQKIIFKTLSFPRASETFVVSNIIEAIKKGYQVEIITETINVVHNSSQQQLLEAYNLMELVTTINPPRHKIKRIFKSFYYLLNPLVIYFFIKYILVKKRFSLSYIFILNFYRKYRNTKVFHIHFANASEDISILKEIGFLNTQILLTMHGYDAYFKNEIELNDLKRTYKVSFDNADRVFINTNYLVNKVLALDCPEKKNRSGANRC